MTTFCKILVDYFIFKIQKQNLGRKAKVAGFFTLQSAGVFGGDEVDIEET